MTGTHSPRYSAQQRHQHNTIRGTDWTIHISIAYVSFLAAAQSVSSCGASDCLPTHCTTGGLQCTTGLALIPARTQPVDRDYIPVY